MTKLQLIPFVTILILSFSFVLSPLAQEKKEAEDIYKIKQGDTLWDIEAKPPEVRPVEKKPDFFDDIRSAGFLSDIDFRGIGIILDSKEGKNLMCAGDIVFLTFKTSKPIMVGDKYTVFRATDEVRHPVTEKKVGRRYNITGNVQIIDQYGNFFTARVIEAFDAILKGDMIRPYMKEKMEVEGGK